MAAKKRNMIRCCFMLLLCLPILLGAQSIQDLEKSLKAATDRGEKLSLNYQLAEKYLGRGNEDKAIEHSNKATELANTLRNDEIAANAFFISGKAYLGKRNTRTADNKFRSSIGYAKKVKALPLVIEGYLERIKIAKKERKNTRLSSLAEEAIEYLTKDSNYRKLKGQELDYKTQVEKLNKERRDLASAKSRLQKEIGDLRKQQSELDNTNSKLSRENTRINRKRREAEKEKDEIAQVVTKKEEAIDKMSAEAIKAKYILSEKKHLIDSLDQQRMLDAIAIRERDTQLENAALLKTQTKYLGGIGISLVLLFGALSMLFYSRYRSKKSQSEILEQNNKAIAEERERSEELLLNILPANIAHELKDTGKAKARRYDQVTVLFTDFKNFTRIAERLSPEQLVKELDDCFKAFDMIISQYPDIEKIKTIGDAYMCAGGFGKHRMPDHIVQAALEFQEYLDEIKAKKQRLGLPFFEARIGLHTGPVVAGVVGSKKFAYDIWGDTVNIAARMEQNSEVGRVNVSEMTHKLIQYKFQCKYRGKMQAKNKGMIDMYFVEKAIR